ncbi:MAG: hypothetical protein HONBIEJF_02808 [Fimbriimonadaceae bacterium]|nr:hypothetical protein [Fimbriimonadaceae bacterium]
MKEITLTVLVMTSLVAVLGSQKVHSTAKKADLYTSKDRVPMDFEAVATGKLPKTWVVPTQGYVAEVIDWDKASGKKCAHLKQVGKPEHGFGNLMSAVKGKDLAGKVVEYSVKVKNLSSPLARIWMRVDRTNGEVGAFDNMGYNGVKMGGWQEAKIRLRIDKDAKYVMFGAMAGKSGDILIDDVQIRVIR